MILLVAIALIFLPTNMLAESLLTESFDNTSMPGAAYNTFDPSIFDSSTRQGSSGYSVRWTWQTGEEEPDGVNTASRWTFSQTTDQLYISFYWYPAANWVGSGDAFHPHLIYIIPELWTNLSGGDLRIYIELSNRQLRMIVGQGESGTFYDTGDNINLSEWSHVECWFVLNTVGQPNGIMKMWLNGAEIYSNSAVSYRTSSDVHLGAIALGPWISDAGVGSPQQQTLYMDSMVITDEQSYARPSSITGISITGGCSIQ